MSTRAHLKLISVRRGLYRVIAGFTHEKLTQRNADWISSDFRYFDDDIVNKVVAQAKMHLKTDNVVMVNGWYTKNKLKWAHYNKFRKDWESA